MYQYRDYAIQLTEDGDYLIRDSSGEVVGCCVSDYEAEEYIDGLYSRVEPEVSVPEPLFYVYRISKYDRDCYGNYQYYTGRGFKFGVSDIKYMTREQCDKVIRRFERYAPEYVYRIEKHHQ